MTKRFTVIFFIVLGIIALLMTGFVLVLFLAPGFSAFGVRYIALNTRNYDSGEIRLIDEVGAFTGDIEINAKEVPIYVYFTQANGGGNAYKVRYYENFSGFTKSKIEDPSIEITKRNGVVVININEYEKFIFQNANTKKFVNLYIPMENISGTGAGRTNLTINTKSSSIVFDRELPQSEEDLRVPSFKNVTINGNGNIKYNVEMRAITYSLSTNNSILITDDKLSSFNAVNYKLNSNKGKIEIKREVSGDLYCTTKNGKITFLTCKNFVGETTYGDIYCSDNSKQTELAGIVKITTKTGNITLGNVNGTGDNEIVSGSGNVKIKKIKDGSIETKRGSVQINSVNKMKITTNMGKVNVEEVLTSIDVSTKRGRINLGGENMVVNNPKVFSRLGRVNVTSALGEVYIETVSSDVVFNNKSSENITIYAGGKLTATALTGKINITANQNTTLDFAKITDNATIKMGKNCKSLLIKAYDDAYGDTRFIISGKMSTIYEDDPTDDVDPYKMVSGEQLTNKKDGTGALLDVTAANANIDVYFKVTNTEED